MLWLRAGTAAALGIVGSATMLALSPGAVLAESSTQVAVDRQDYVTTSPVDPFAASGSSHDPTNVHVAISAGQEQARSFVHIELNTIPIGGSPTDAVVTLKEQAESNYGGYSNAGVDSAHLKACLLKQELAANFDPSNPPAYDSSVCVAGKAAVDSVSNGTNLYRFTFDLKPLVQHWAAGQNTGAAILPDEAGNQTATWSVALDRARSTASVSYIPPAQAVTNAYQAPAPAPQVSTYAGPAGQGYSVGAPPPPVPNQLQSSAPATGPPTLNTQPAAPKNRTSTAPPSSPSSAGYPLWALLLVGSACALAGLVGPPLAQALSHRGGNVGAGLLLQLRAHPRMFVAAGALTAWSATFTTYSLATSKTPGGNQAAAPVTTSAGQSSGGLASPAAGASATPTNPQPGSLAAVLPEHPAGRVERVGTVNVVVPSSGGPPIADLYQGADDTTGIYPDHVNLCAHAALVFGPAFHISASDLNVFWQNVNDHGGIYGRKVIGTYQDDQYQPGPAVQAAQACANQPGGTFFLLGGIGFDQIPAVRVWAEQNHMLYIHHIATEAGAQGLRYSFAPLPSVEQVGTYFGELYMSKYAGKKVGILWRNSGNWEGGHNAFKHYLAAHGMSAQIVVDDPVNNNQENYQKEIIDLKAAGAEVAFGWENALAAGEMVQQAKGQAYSPHWLIFPFNLTSQTLGNQAMTPPLDGVAAWSAYSCRDYSGMFASYANDIKEFEREYAQYDGSVDLCSVGGDLLFLNWVAQKSLAQLFYDCGPQCTRNKVAGLLLAGYKGTVSPNCEADWSRRPHYGGYQLSVFNTFMSPTQKPNGDNNIDWEPAIICKERIY